MNQSVAAGLLTTLLEMGGDLALENRRIEGGEEVADIRARYSPISPASRFRRSARPR